MIYAFGSNGTGQLGIRHTDDISEPQQMHYDHPHDLTAQVKQIVAGGNHTLVLFTDGTVMSTGNNEDGRCGHALSYASLSSLRAVLLQAEGSTTRISRFVDIAATWSASFFVAEDRQTVYVCGAGEHGELGLGPGVTLVSTPGRIWFPDTIQSIASCLSHTVAVLTNGEAWGWGKGRKGQLGEPKEDCWSPRRISDVEFPAITAMCGADFTCILDRPREGRVQMLGSDQKDRFRLHADKPVHIPGWTTAATSWGSVLIQTEHGMIAWGRNDRGQLPSRDIPALEKLAAGSEHWLALTMSGTLLAGGWGEHGNCGIPTDKYGVVKDRWNVINTPGTVEQIFAGCATSFFVVQKLPVS